MRWSSPILSAQGRNWKQGKSMPSKLKITAILSTLAIATSAVAHHSYAMFDRSKKMTVQGTVVEWQWTNPHTFLEVMGPGPDKQPVKFVLEGASPSFLTPNGFSRKMMVPGDKVTVTYYPHRSRPELGQLAAVRLADGKDYTVVVARL